MDRVQAFKVLNVVQDRANRAEGSAEKFAEDLCVGDGTEHGEVVSMSFGGNDLVLVTFFANVGEVVRTFGRDATILMSVETEECDDEARPAEFVPGRGERWLHGKGS